MPLHNGPHVLLLTFSAPSILSIPLFLFAAALPLPDSVLNCHSNPITQRVRRRRQRLPPSLLIENASGLIFRLPHNSLVEAFPIKASDNTSRICPFPLDSRVRCWHETRGLAPTLQFWPKLGQGTEFRTLAKEDVDLFFQSVGVVDRRAHVLHVFP